MMKPGKHWLVAALFAFVAGVGGLIVAAAGDDPAPAPSTPAVDPAAEVRDACKEGIRVRAVDQGNYQDVTLNTAHPTVTGDHGKVTGEATLVLFDDGVRRSAQTVTYTCETTRNADGVMVPVDAGWTVAGST